MNAFISVAFLLYAIVDLSLHAALTVKEIKEREKKRNKEEIERKRLYYEECIFLYILLNGWFYLACATLIEKEIKRKIEW